MPKYQLNNGVNFNPIDSFIAKPKVKEVFVGALHFLISYIQILLCKKAKYIYICYEQVLVSEENHEAQ